MLQLPLQTLQAEFGSMHVARLAGEGRAPACVRTCSGPDTPNPTHTALPSATSCSCEMSPSTRDSMFVRAPVTPARSAAQAARQTLSQRTRGSVLAGQLGCHRQRAQQKPCGRIPGDAKRPCEPRLRRRGLAGHRHQVDEALAAQRDAVHALLQAGEGEAAAGGPLLERAGAAFAARRAQKLGCLPAGSPRTAHAGRAGHGAGQGGPR